MKILLIQTYHYHRGGDSTYTFSLAKLLEGKGHEVIHFAMQHPENYESKFSKYFVDYIDYRELNTNRTLSNGIKVLLRSIYSIDARAKIKELINEYKPDIAHIQNYLGHLTPSIIFELEKQNIPIVQTLHDYKYLCPNTHLLSHGKICEKCNGKKFYNATFNKCKKSSLSASLIASIDAYIRELFKINKRIDIFISPSEFLKNKFIEFGWDSNNITVINNFLDESFFNNKKKEFKENDYVLYFGQLEEWKGIASIIKAIHSSPDINLKIVGNGSEEKKILKLIYSLNAKNIEMLGYKKSKELQDIIIFSCFVIVPSELYENYPYSIMEAMVMGKPVIASNIGGLPELIKDEENGLLFKPGNIEELRKKIQILWNDDKKRKAMSENALKLASNLFSPEKHYQKIISIYNELLERK